LVGNVVTLLRKERTGGKAADKNEYFCLNVAEYKLNMFRLAKSILHNDTDAEDAVSEAILKAYDKLHTLKNLESFKPWIMRILVNESYKLSNRRKKVVYLDEIEIKKEIIENDNQELWNTVEMLDGEFRTVTVLFYYEDLSIKEISEVLSLPIGTVKSRLSRARNKLKEMLNIEGRR
jgi:RNA polymerase sigma-70 factor (ECF subfamily)